MVFFNYATMQMAAKIVYYGPGLCGKTTNLQHIYQKTSPKSRGEMVSLETETDRTLFFDLLPLDVGNIAGFKTRFQLYTVPGQVFYNSTRKLVLRGVDGIVFVADSQIPMMEANIESLSNLRENLSELGLNVDEIPMVYQFNKRDLKNVLAIEEMNRVLNPRTLPHFEASALQGNGVFETLKGISKATLITLRKKALGEEKPRVPEAPVKAGERPKMPTPPPPPVGQPRSPLQTRPMNPPMQTPVVMQNHPAAGSPTPISPASEVSPIITPSQAPSVPAMPTAAEIAKEKVEFSVATKTTQSPPEMKKIALKTRSDIGSKLDALRDLYTAKGPSKSKKDSSTSDDPLSALLESTKGKDKKPLTKKLKIRLDPDEVDAVKSLSLDFHLTGGAVHRRFSNAFSVPGEGKGNPKKVVLRIEVEILKK